MDLGKPSDPGRSGRLVLTLPGASFGDGLSRRIALRKPDIALVASRRRVFNCHFELSRLKYRKVTDSIPLKMRPRYSVCRYAFVILVP